MELCDKEPSIPIFANPWWLDAVVGSDGWGVVLIERGNHIEASLPYYKKSKWGIQVLTTPPLTPALGPWLREYTAKSYKVISREKELLRTLYSLLPKCDVYQQNWHVSRQNWQPLYWLGYSQTSSYTYRLEDLTDLDRVWAGMHQNTRNDIRKAGKRYSLNVRPAKSVQEFTRVANKTFERQKLTAPYSNELIESIYLAANARGAIDLLVAEDPEGKLHAAAMILKDDDTAYYLMGGGDPEYRMSGAAGLILWEAIQRVSNHVKIFDFEGSMIEPIERFFRCFGARQTPYHHVYKANSLLGRAILFMQNQKRTQVKTAK